MNSSFDCDPTIDVRGVFLDISKAFDKVWHEGILFKLKTYGVNGEVLTLLTNYLYERYQRVVMNGQSSSWELVKSVVPQGSVLGPLFFLIYTNDLPDNLESNCKIFADDTSLFYKVFDKHVSRATLNKDLELINNLDFQWKMQFNPDRHKQAQELYFSKKAGNQKSLDLTFNESNVASSPSVKHLGMLLDGCLNFNEHVQSKTNKCYKIIGLIKQFSIHLPREALPRIYKSFVRPNLDYGDIIFDKPNNESFKSRTESIQYKACIAITGAIQGTSREHLYRELGIESLSDRCWFRKLALFYKIVKGLSPTYLTKYVNLRSTSNYQTRSANKNNLQEFSCRTICFKYSFFPFCVREWNKLDNTIRNAESIKQFKLMLTNFLSLNQISLFSIHDPVGVKLLMRLRLQFSHLNEHKFRHNFNDCVSLMCDCGAETETTGHFFLRCQFFADKKTKAP